MAFNEDSRVKITALLHLMRLGYSYISKYEQKRIDETNIFPDIFKESLKRINPEVTESELNLLLEKINLKLDYEDLGKKFYERLTATYGIKLIDFENFNNKRFYIAIEFIHKSLYKNITYNNIKSNRCSFNE